MKLLANIKNSGHWGFFLRYFLLFLMLFISMALGALFFLLKKQGNPFFYSNF